MTKAPTITAGKKKPNLKKILIGQKMAGKLK